ncbi:hypothetical protein C4D60_Mb01t29400 [Musa balbisiana]|uniref:Uncharacterized protein n=1 Tax=Musa balbisiana TaxID=52838 RepID=A0A4S8JRM0_MUSBA|nr:hypothetical protein C4D60_Mb01t29400 [Musa balbisiana]
MKDIMARDERYIMIGNHDGSIDKAWRGWTTPALAGIGLQQGHSSSYVYVVAGGMGGGSVAELMTFVDAPKQKLELGCEAW